MVMMSPFAKFKASTFKFKALSAIVFITVCSIAMEWLFGLHAEIKSAETTIDILVILTLVILFPTILILAVELVWKSLSPVVKVTFNVAKSNEAKAMATIVSESSGSGVRSLRDQIRYDVGSISGEMGRLKMVMYHLIGVILIFPLLNGILLFPEPNLFDLIIALVPLISLAAFISYKLLIIPCAKRTVSLGMNPWLALALLVPAINIPVYIFMVFAPRGAGKGHSST